MAPVTDDRPTLALPGVPVGLLLAVEAHVDDLVRDLTLAGSTSASHRDNAVPEGVAHRVEQAATSIAPLRRSLKRQALEGRAAGSDEFEATVRIDTPGEASYYRNGGIMPFVLRNLLRN